MLMNAADLEILWSLVHEFPFSSLTFVPLLYILLKNPFDVSVFQKKLCFCGCMCVKQIRLFASEDQGPTCMLRSCVVAVATSVLSIRHVLGVLYLEFNFQRPNLDQKLCVF
uniref:Uncharacterized protein n=1 Tax=Sphaerodactylus townsendi TaxID=933632 RepID=A0ACB8EG52_9SAUR